MQIVKAFVSALLIAGSLGLFSSGALAAEDDGMIADINIDALTITLDNGNTYKLPGEFNTEALVEGAEVTVAYDTVEGVRQITDIVIYE